MNAIDKDFMLLTDQLELCTNGLSDTTLTLTSQLMLTLQFERSQRTFNALEEKNTDTVVRMADVTEEWTEDMERKFRDHFHTDVPKTNTILLR